MGKSYLIIDTPENCLECKLKKYYVEIDTFTCEVGLAVGSRWGHINLESKPDWCPLRPLPDKLKFHDCKYNAEVKGWNDCIDKILKEE